jgi:hypothetical protein
VSRECTLDAMQNGAGRKRNGCAHAWERVARSRRPRRVHDQFRARALAGPMAGRDGWQRLGGVDGGQRALMVRQQRLAFRRSLYLHGHAHGRCRREREER